MQTPSLNERLRQAMGFWASGVTVVVAQHGEEVRGMTASSFTSVSLEPPLVLVCVNQNTQTWPILEAAGRFSINFLAEGQEAVSSHFAGRPLEGFNPLTQHQPPLVEGALLSLVCSTQSIYPGGSHKIVVGLVEDVVMGLSQRPLLYWNRAYRRLTQETP